MQNKVVIAYSKDEKKDVEYIAPIYGKAKVRKIEDGIFVSSLTTAESEKNKNNSCSGGSAKMFSKDFSGEGEIVSTVISKNGGQSSTPYNKVTKTFVGVIENEN